MYVKQNKYDPLTFVTAKLEIGRYNYCKKRFLEYIIIELPSRPVSLADAYLD